MAVRGTRVQRALEFDHVVFVKDDNVVFVRDVTGTGTSSVGKPTCHCKMRGAQKLNQTCAGISFFFFYSFSWGLGLDLIF